MSKIELLSPAGNMECLKSAVLNGADAVYLGGKKFGARHFAANFDNLEMIEAIKFCHLYGVKIYVTVNTICYEDELEEALDYIEFLYDNNVDALIMQDLGLITLVRKKFPNLEIHASTQAHNHNDEGIRALKELGVKRVVLAREMSLDEIKNLKTNIEKEVFIHGALCVSYSGCCLFSAMNGGRSGNRGECVGSCRLPYKLYENDKEVKTDGDYLLSMRSLCTLEHIGKLIDANITSLKIEGRMKSPEYVSYITRLYRTKIDEYYKNKEINVSNEEIKNIKKLYNRELTKGYLFNDYGKSIMNIKSPNHIGIHLGNVIKVDKYKIKIKLDDTLNQEDGIRFDNDKGMIVNKLYNEKGLLVNKLEKGNVAILDNKIGLKNAKEVRKTTDVLLNKEINEFEKKKVKISITCNAFIGKKLELVVSDNIDTIKKYGNVIEKALNCSTDKERVKTQLEKLGGTPFVSQSTSINMDENIFISIKELNDLRREIVEELINTRENKSLYDKVKNNFEEEKLSVKNKDLKISVLVRNEEQLKVALKNKVDKIFTDSFALYNKYKGNNVYFKTKRVSDDKENFNDENLLVTELGAAFKYSKNNNFVSDYFLNVVNSKTVRYLESLNVKDVTLSPEVNKENIKLLGKENVTLLVYGRVELMVSKYCPINMLANGNDRRCNLCDVNKYYLKDKDDKIYPLINEKHLTHILNSTNLDLLDNLEDYLDYGITSFRIDLYDEEEKDIENIINVIRYAYGYRNNK